MLLAIGYYWAYLYLRVLLPESESSTASYAAAVGPIAAFAAAGVLLRLLAPRGVRFAVYPGAKWAIGFGLLALLVSVWRGDWRTMLASGLLSLTLLWLSMAPTGLSPALLNRLLLASIVVGAIFHAAGWSEYGLFPGQYAEGQDRGITWRVSLFPFVPESGFFAVVVLLANQVAGRGVPRYVCGLLALYFLILSGVRSALICWFLCSILLFLDRRWNRLQPRLRRARRLRACLMFVLLFVVAVASAGVLQYAPGLVDTAIGSYLFRAASEDLNDESIAQSVYRSWLWLQHVDIFMQNPIFGAGTYEFAGVVGESLIPGNTDTGTESIATLWLSRLGLASLPLLAFVLSTARRGAEQQSPLASTALIVLAVASLAYGSFLVPYNFMFLILFTILLAPAARIPRAPRARAMALRTTDAR